MSDARTKAFSAAREARERMGVDPDGSPLIPNLLTLIEENAADPVPVTLLQLPPGVAGAYLRREGRPFIFVSSSTWPVRRRFTIAHEVGHHVLGHKPMIDTEDDLRDVRTVREVEANAFAAEFLAPSNAVRRWFASYADHVSLEAVVRLGHFFGISTEAARYRLEDADLLVGRSMIGQLDAQIKNEEHRQIARRLGLRDDPGASGRDDIAEVALDGRRHPAVVTDRVLAVAAAGLLEPDRIAELLRVKRKSIGVLLGERGVEIPSPEPDASDDESWE